MANKTYLFMISHPAHYHMFKHTIRNLQEDGNRVISVIRPKDVLEQLCINDGFEYLKVKDRPKRWGMVGLAWSLMGKTIEVAKIVRCEKPDMLIGSDGVLAYVGKLYGIPAFECSEDDAEAIHLYARMFFPFYTGIICPECCSAWKWDKKKIGYKSYHELGYLHPNQFTPSEMIASKYVDITRPYVLIRFAQLTAHHDVGIHGMTTEIAQHVIDMLKPHFEQIYITSERPLEPQFEQYRIAINPIDMHHVMAYASLYIGDSQTMAAEAGVVGTPFVRFNDFVGRLSYLNELEWDYKLGFGHKTHDVEGFYKSIQTWLDTPNRKGLCADRRDKMLSEKIDYAKFLTWFIEAYPASRDTMKSNPDVQWRFK